MPSCAVGARQRPARIWGKRYSQRQDGDGAYCETRSLRPAVVSHPHHPLSAWSKKGVANRLSATDDRREFPGIFYFTGGVDLRQCISCFSGDFPLFFACFGPENFITVPNQHHTFSDLREGPGNTGPPPLPGALSHIHSKTACRGALATCGALPRRSRLPPRSVLGAPHQGAAPQPAGETKSFCHFQNSQVSLLRCLAFSLVCGMIWQ